MPPVTFPKPLTDADRDILRRWIDDGAVYEQHWSFSPVRTPVLPAVKSRDWPRNAIDHFVLAEIELAELKPSPRADRLQLARRLYLDLLGLPPTPEQADAFAADERPDAYERLVDELLASPHYGERWARRWLDLARYSDTNGYEKDRPRTMWPYRDWVINALNADMPFDQFTIEQLAGDMLPNSTREQRIATGFHRNTMTNEEGGIDPQEFRFNAVVDRVAVTGATWLGLTLACAQCHTHKYDPITHEEYYRIFALFNNADEIEEQITTPEIADRRAVLQSEINAIICKLPGEYLAKAGIGREGGSSDNEDILDQALVQWRQQARNALEHWRVVMPTHMITNLADIEVLPDESIYVSGDVTKNDVYELEFEVGTERLTALRIEALTDERLPGDGPGRQSIDVPNASAEGDFFLSELTAEVIDGADAKTSRRAPFASATASYVTPGMSPESAFDGRADTGWRVMGRQSEPHAAVFVFGEPLTVPAGGRLRLRLQHESFYPAGLGRFRISVARAGAAEHPLALYPEGIAELLRMPDAALSPTDRRELLHFFLLQTPELEERHEEVAALRRQLPRPVNALILKERTKRPRVTRRHHRGEYLSPRGPVSPGSLDVLPPLPSDQAANRLAFARWLVDGRNPLVARVMVNRQWQAFFGRGIVPTLEDFGLQGYFPSHPDLLDYLASELVSQGWSMKRLHKLIVMSATYQQDMEVTPELLAKDPENKLLARAPRFRVEAELVRDATLTASGLLCREVGGPSVFPDQPAGITESAYGPLEWKMSPGKDRYRRGLYTFNKRTAPFAMFGLFDAPSGEACAPRRSTSNTPLQALAMLNETTMMAAARMLATTSLAECREERSIAERMIRRCVTRVPDEQELDAVVAFYHAAKRRLESGDLEAAKIIRAGDESVAVPQESADDVAAWMLTARAVLNLDEVITRQ